MRKLNLSFALLAAVAVAIAAAPADAATKKKTSKAKATTSQPIFVSHFNSCANTSSRMWLPVAAVGTVGCGVVYGLPVAFESFWMPRA